MPSTITDVWKAFADWIEAHGGGAYLFRGQTENIPVRPKIGRAPYGYALPRELQMFQAFKRAARPFVSVPPASDFEWLALAQHHGLPTRLADWSTSPLVAAWFAISSFPSGTDAIIYALAINGNDQNGVEAFDIVEKRTAVTNARYDTPWEMRTRVYLIETAPVSARITTQRGLFTLHGDPTQDLVIPANDHFPIPANLREPFQARLLDVGVDAAHIFPDLDGVCRTLDWRLRTGKAFSAII